MRKILIPLALTILLVACGGNPKVSGEVVGRDHDGEHSWVAFFPICTSTGKTTSCIPVPFFMRDDEDWYLIVRDDETGKNKKVKVSESVYTTTGDGSYFSNKPLGDKVTKVRK